MTGKLKQLRHVTAVFCKGTGQNTPSDTHWLLRMMAA